MDQMPFNYKLGRPLKYTPSELLDKFAEYVQWCHDHPLADYSTTRYANGNFAHVEEPKPRRISIDGFLVFVGGSDRWWSELKNGKEGENFSKVKDAIKKYCETSQTDMAAAGLLKENIISRLLGLADRQQVDGQVEYRYRFSE